MHATQSLHTLKHPFMRQCRCDVPPNPYVHKSIQSITHLRRQRLERAREREAHVRDRVFREVQRQGEGLPHLCMYVRA